MGLVASPHYLRLTRSMMVMACVGIAGCVAVRPPAATSPLPPSEPAPSTAAPAVPTAPPPGAEAIASAALELAGTPYRAGGDTPSGFDCSGFTRYLFGQHGIALPRQARDQFDVGQQVATDDIRTGDLIFFSTVAPGASHVGVALDDDRFIHAPSSRGRVRIERISTSYWSRRYVGARRLVGDGARRTH